MPSERPDLAALVYPLVKQLIALETPLLTEHKISMWGYSVLTALDETPVRTQAALAEAIGADKSRIIGTLDELQKDGLIDRTPDPDDRRARLLAITTKGRHTRRALQKDIRAEEERLLAGLAAEDREAFIRVLRALTGR